jgi:DNA-binding NtrC family response regulator
VSARDPADDVHGEGDSGATLVTDLQSGRPLLRRLSLVVVEGPDEGARVALDTGTVLIGSRGDVDLVLHDRRVSRVHVEARRSDDVVRLRDAGSRNGLLIGDARVDEARLPIGARFRIGATTIAVAAEDAPLQLDDGPARFGGLMAVAAPMRRLHALLARAARADVTVLLEGETGVGKEVLARALHAESPRRDGPFLVVDCGVLSRELLGSELFGHRRGAFTGAIADRQGLFEAAAGGTVLLDEIGEMPLDLQPALLRVLETRQVRRVGDSAARPVDVRVVAATHRDLAALVREGRFREDLFFRLAVVRARVPALRDRREDLPLLADQILARLGTPLRPGSAELARLAGHRWPGNVRELKNALEQAVALGDGALALPDLVATGGDQPPAPAPRRRDAAAEPAFAVDDLLARPFSEARDEALLRFERHYMQAALARAAGNVSRAAADVGLTRPYAHRVLKRTGLRGDDEVG